MSSPSAGYTMSEPLSAEENEVLQEVVNIGMGQAGASLAKLLNAFVRLSVPQIRWVSGADFTDQVAQLVDGSEECWTGVRQGFYNQLEGEVFALYGAAGCRQLGELLRYGEEDAAEEEERLLDVTNILMGACLVGVAEQLQRDVDFTPPSLIEIDKSIDQLLANRERNWRQCLLMEVNFHLEEIDFSCHLVILLSENSIGQLRAGLLEFMESF